MTSELARAKLDDTVHSIYTVHCKASSQPNAIRHVTYSNVKASHHERTHIQLILIRV